VHLQKSITQPVLTKSRLFLYIIGVFLVYNFDFLMYSNNYHTVFVILIDVAQRLNPSGSRLRIEPGPYLAASRCTNHYATTINKFACAGVDDHVPWRLPLHGGGQAQPLGQGNATDNLLKTTGTIAYRQRFDDHCCGSGSGIRCLFDPGIRNRFFPDPGSQTHIFESLVTTFWVRSSIIL
jgi:hypothetical protein